jgi:putative holliday junction resolvase
MSGMPQTYLGFDYGEKKIGVAISQSITQTCAPLEIIASINGKPDWQAIEKVIRQWQPECLIVGVPYHMDKTSQPLTLKAQKFGRQLNGRFQLEVFEVDERLSTQEARYQLKSNRQKKLAKRAGQVDHLAAALILQTWLDTNAAS